MNKLIFQFLISTAIIATAPVAWAEDVITHSLYKVTTYNLGSSVDFQDFSPVSSQKYRPLLITNTKADILGADRFKEAAFDASEDRGATNGFAVAAEYSPLAKLAFQGIIGATKNNWDPNTTENKSSWEANLGVIYKMFDNLRYEMHFGYMDTGDLFKGRNTYTDVESIIMISNQLTMSF